ncbi:hypothetical protein PG994_002777 [Apiospora phragmitis]|uniref:Cytochrome P450 n=1 Tax=Apiospora phragmitis TaxID=2905665 RepID=A0ABR1W640_9PEZI
MQTLTLGRPELAARPTLSPFQIFEKQFQTLASDLEARTGEDGAVLADLKEPLFDFTFSVITEFLLGPAASTSSAEGKAFAESFNTAFKWISKRERLKAFYWLIDGWEFRASCRRARSLVAEFIRRTKQCIDDSGGLEDRIALFRLMKDDNEISEVRDQFMNLLLAGRDTSGSLLCWCIYVLAREQSLLRALRAEAGQVLGGRLPTKDDFGKMKLLDQYISVNNLPVLRLFPPVPINGRICNTDTILPRGGDPAGEPPMFCPEGTLLCFSAYAVQTDKYLWDSADKFDVERWSRETSLTDRITDWSYQPFVGGPRKCLGGELPRFFVSPFVVTLPLPTSDDKTVSAVWLNNKETSRIIGDR